MTNKGKPMARLNLTIPDSVKAEIDALAETDAEINWSAIATKAFKKFLKKHRMRSVWNGSEHDVVPTSQT